jgi:hypothetical protein
MTLLMGSVSGFTYDQQAEPSSPTAGETWRERTAGGLIVESWQWSGSVWTELIPRFFRFLVGSADVISEGHPGNRILIETLHTSGRVATGPPNYDETTNFWRVSIQHSFGQVSDIPIANNATLYYVGGGDFHYRQSVTVNTILGSSVTGGSDQLFAAVRAVGSPTAGAGGGSTLSCTAIYRRVR